MTAAPIEDEILAAARHLAREFGVPEPQTREEAERLLGEHADRDE